MNAPTETFNSPAGICPMHAAPALERLLKESDELVLPMHKRMVAQYATNAAGAKELFLYYEDKEISFDEPELFSFGEQLAKQERFVAGTAVTWSLVTWPRIQELLEQLLDVGVIHYADRYAANHGAPKAPRNRPAPLPPGPARKAHTWSECESIMQSLTGRSLEQGYLELVIPIFRIAHMAVDADARQVGEANVFPKDLRLDIPTEWRVCSYAGTRHQSDRPMNITALKSMCLHWREMMAMVLIIRRAFLERFPEARAGWTVGHLERLATSILAVPSYMLMRNDNPVKSGELHPALSSLFRVTDGVRMTMHQMMFVPIGEPTIPPDTPMSSSQILAYAERNYSFHSEHGVCAGPSAMIDELLRVLVDGDMPKEGVPDTLPAALQAAMDVLPQAIDYGLLGLKAHAIVFSLWPAMARTYEEISDITRAWAEEGNLQVGAINARFSQHLSSVRHATYLASEQWRADREHVYVDMHDQSCKGLTGNRPACSLAESIQQRSTTDYSHDLQQLREIIASRLAMNSSEASPHLEQFVNTLAAFLRLEQTILQLSVSVQHEINVLLGRQLPKRPFSAHDIDLYNQLQGANARTLPYLVSEIEAMFDLDISLDMNTLRIMKKSFSASATPAGESPNSAGACPLNMCTSHAPNLNGEIK